MRDHAFDIFLTSGCSDFNIKQQDNLLFRQIRIITGNYGEFNPYTVFVDCKAGKNDEENLSHLISFGFFLNGRRFVMGERSASMTRNSILSFVDEAIYDELNERVTMGVQFDKTVLSKYYAYRGLMLSSCHCLDDWYPKIIVVPDYMRKIPNQHIKYMYDNTVNFVDKNGLEREWKQKDIAETVRDIEINVYDGCGIHHPAITCEVQDLLGSTTRPTSILLRLPYIKGVSHEVDYEQFFADRGITSIKDIWGVEHSVSPGSEPMIILSESMYKGVKYFKRTGNYEDWENYWVQFKKYNHCIGIAKWNFSLDEEPAYTRANYQILQDLDLPYEKFSKLAADSIEWAQKIIDGDPVHTYCFLGLLGDNCKPMNDYAKSILKNPEMIKEFSVRNYLLSLLEKYIDDMKCGKLWIKACFKYLVPDLIMMMEHIAGLDPVGCLSEGEFYSLNKSGVLLGKHLIERNPHICRSEHVMLNGVEPDEVKKYFSNLVNICMVNGKSITPQRLNGADYDGDLVLVVEDELMMSGVATDIPVVIDVDDKITAQSEEDTVENRLSVTLRTMKNLIGEYSNYATAYHNKTPKTPEQKKQYEKFVDIISINTGKSIDYAKTGVLYPMPRNIAKFGRPLPYFMRYASEYYKNQKLSKTNSNLNRLCREIEKWEKSCRWKRTYKDFDYRIMIDDSIETSKETFEAVENVYLNFCQEMKQLHLDQKSINEDGINSIIDWEYYYNQFRKDCAAVCPDKHELANIAVTLCYEKYKNSNKKFIWRVAGDGVIDNIKQQDIQLPAKDIYGNFEYLGKKYRMVDYKEELLID